MFSWKLKTSFIIIGERLFLTLKISVAKYCKFFIWTETDLSFCNNFSKRDCLSWYNILRALWCVLLILLKIQLRHIQNNGQSLSWKVTNILNKIRFLFGDNYCDIRTMHVVFDQIFACELIPLMIESLMFYGSRLIGW